MTIVSTVAFGLSWLLAAWAFMLWGVDTLQSSYILRVLDWNSRIGWIRGHRASFVILAGLKLFQIGFVVWLARLISQEVPSLTPVVTVYQWLAIAVVLCGNRKRVPRDLSVQVGGCEWVSGRWIRMWRSGRAYKGLVLKDDGTLREGYISEETFQQLKNNNCEKTVSIGLLPAMVCFAAWACNALALLAGVVIFIW
jgi:hypothetical protein